MNKEYEKKRKGRQPGRTAATRRRPSARVNPRRRKLRMALLYTLMILSVLGVAIALSLTVLFKIDTIEIAGESRYDQTQIMELSGVRSGQNLFLCKAKEGAAAIEKALPYIQSAQISRKIPSKILITVTEAVPAGSVEYNGRYLVLSSLGKVLELTDKPAEGLPIIRGLQLTSAELGELVSYREDNVRQTLESITESISRHGLKGIQEIDLTQPTNPTLNYENRITIKLGQPIDLDLKIRTAIEILTKNLEGTDKGVLDVSLAKENNKSFFRPEYESSSEPVSSAPPADSQPSAENPQQGGDTPTDEPDGPDSPGDEGGDSSEDADPPEPDTPDSGQEGEDVPTDAPPEDEGEGQAPAPDDGGDAEPAPQEGGDVGE